MIWYFRMMVTGQVGMNLINHKKIYDNKNELKTDVKSWENISEKIFFCNPLIHSVTFPPTHLKFISCSKPWYMDERTHITWQDVIRSHGWTSCVEEEKKSLCAALSLPNLLIEGPRWFIHLIWWKDWENINF